MIELNAFIQWIHNADVVQEHLLNIIQWVHNVNMVLKHLIKSLNKINKSLKLVWDLKKLNVLIVFMGQSVPFHNGFAATFFA